MVKKTLKRNNKNISIFSGGSNVWGDLLKMSIIPSTNIKQGGKYNKNTLKKNLYKPLGNRNTNKILEGGFIRAGSTQYFPVNCTRMENNQSVQQNNQEGGNSKVWGDLLKMSIIPSLEKKGGRYNKKTLKNKLYKPIGNKNINNIMEGGFIRGGSTQYFPVNCTRIDNQPSQTVKQEGGNLKKMIGGTEDANIESAKEISKLILIVGENIKNSFGGKINVAIDIFKEYIKEILNAAGIVSVNVEDINDELIKKNGYSYKIDNSFGQPIDTDNFNQFNLLYYVINQSMQGIDVTIEKNKTDENSGNGLKKN